MTTEPRRPDWLTPQVWPFEVRHLGAPDGRVAYVDEGSGPVLLFSHAGMWAFLWRDVVVALRDRYRCITFDAPGSGLSTGDPRRVATLDAVRVTVATLVTELDLTDVTLVLHDLGGAAALAASTDVPGRVAAVAAVNTFGWRPRGFVLPAMLTVFGSAWMRELHAWTGWLARLSTSRFGVGRHLDRDARRAFRRGMDRRGRRTMHRLFRSARRSSAVYAAADEALGQLADRPALSVFGAWGDHLRFRPRWRAALPALREVTVPRGLHFPMCDDPALVATTIDAWHRDEVAPTVAPSVERRAAG